MSNEGIAIAAVMITAVVLLFVAIRKKSDLILNFVLRGILGTIGMYLINQLLLTQELAMTVAINPITVLTSAGLGVPGLILLYGIRLYSIL